MLGLCPAYSRFNSSDRVPPSAVVRANEDGGAEDDDDVEVIPDVARTASEGVEGEGREGGDVVHVADDVPDLDTLQVEPALSSAPGVETVYLFPNNPDKSRCFTARHPLSGWTEFVLLWEGSSGDPCRAADRDASGAHQQRSVLPILPSSHPPILQVEARVVCARWHQGMRAGGGGSGVQARLLWR